LHIGLGAQELVGQIGVLRLQVGQLGMAAAAANSSSLRGLGSWFCVASDMNNVRKKWIPLANWGVVSGFKGGLCRSMAPEMAQERHKNGARKTRPKAGRSVKP
jgi:hypothetical protein